MDEPLNLGETIEFIGIWFSGYNGRKYLEGLFVFESSVEDGGFPFLFIFFYEMSTVK